MSNLNRYIPTENILWCHLVCWEDYWCSPANPSRTVYIQSEEKGSENHSGSLTSKPSPFWTFAIWPALQSRKYQDSQAQEQFLPPRQSILWTVKCSPHCAIKMCNNLKFICYRLHPSTSLHLTLLYSYSIIYSTTVHKIYFIFQKKILFIFTCVFFILILFFIVSVLLSSLCTGSLWQ